MSDLPKTDYVGLIAIRRRPNEWFAKCTRKLQAIANLESNWDSYGSERPDSVSLHYAYAFLHFLRDKVNVSEPAITASSNGNICFEWDNGTFSLFVEIDAAGRCHYYYERGCFEEERTERDFAPILQMLTRL